MLKAKKIISFCFLGYFEKSVFRPISLLFEKFYPRNIYHMPAVNFFQMPRQSAIPGQAENAAIV